jgi:hypothetical protein
VQSKEKGLDFPLAVNGTLMRGLELNPRMLAVGGRFDREATTTPQYRLWSIDDRHPAMIRVREGGVAVAVEVWRIPETGFAQLLIGEPPGLCIGKVQLADGEETLGVLGSRRCARPARDHTLRRLAAYLRPGPQAAEPICVVARRSCGVAAYASVDASPSIWAFGAAC